MTLRYLVGASLLVVLGRPLSGQEPAPSASLTLAADTLFARWAGTTTPGCAVRADRHGEVIFRRAYGMANLESGTPNTPRTVFLAASIAKQITAMAVMLLVQRGKVSLEDDVHRFIPELPDYGAPITLRQLLTHTSGLRDYFEMLILARGRFEEDRITQADFMDIVTRQKALNFRPGAEFLYSNSSFALLALVVQRVSGKPLATFAQEEIFAPLGMTNTRFLDDYSKLVPGRAAGYRGQGDGLRLGFPNYDVYGATNLYTTVDDLLAWAANLMHPRVGDDRITREMTTKAALNNGDSVDYGFGLSLVTDHGRRVIEHEGSDPGFRGYLGVYPAEDFSVAVLCNTRSVDAVGLGHNVALLFLGNGSAAATYQDLPRVQLDTLSQARRAGIYFDPTGIEVLVLAWRDGHLYTDPQGGRRLDPVGRDSFQLEARPVVYVFDPRPNSAFLVTSLYPGHHPDRFEWRPAPPPHSRGGLRAYTGRFFSQELNASFDVTATDSTIHLQSGTSSGLTARLAFPDTFESGQLVIQFLRSRGAITSFRISHPRARQILFTRVTGP